jgi:hypothetical protein
MALVRIKKNPKKEHAKPRISTRAIAHAYFSR